MKIFWSRFKKGFVCGFVFCVRQHHPRFLSPGVGGIRKWICILGNLHGQCVIISLGIYLRLIPITQFLSLPIPSILAGSSCHEFMHLRVLFIYWLLLLFRFHLFVLNTLVPDMHTKWHSNMLSDPGVGCRGVESRKWHGYSATTNNSVVTIIVYSVCDIMAVLDIV